MDVRGVIRAGAWVVGGAIALVVALYLIVVIVNWRDEPPSADARRIVALERDRPAVADGDNAFVHLLGMGAPPTADAVAIGSRTRAWLERFDAATGHSRSGTAPAVDPDPGYRAARAADVAAVAGACSKAPGCAEALRVHPGALDRWIASERWLLDRYDRMLGLRQWREVIPKDPRAPMATYQHAMEAQKLYLLVAHRRAVQGDAAAVRALLGRDLAFWRGVLASSDLLITKMIAASAVRRNFELGNLALRALPMGQVRAAVPPSWTRPLTVEERSLSRALAGEWHFGAGVMAMTRDPRGYRSAITGDVRVRDSLARPFLKPQATLNLGAARMVRLGQATEAPYPGLRRALHAAVRPTGKASFALYNPAGRALDSMAQGANYTDYVGRVSDLEGLRRMAVLVVSLRAAGTAPDDVARALAASRLRSPYDDRPFAWDASGGSVVFKGLASGTRGEHALQL